MRLVWSLALALAVTGCSRDVAEEGADLLLRGGIVRTMDAGTPMASAVAVSEGRIVYVGDDVGADVLVGPRTEVVELAGRLMLPGFHDTHVHPVEGGAEQGDCDLHSAETLADVTRMVRACAERARDTPWLRGGGYQLPIFPGGEPSMELLDSLVPERPAYLTDATEHSAWVNSRALALADIDASTPDPPPDGIIVRKADGSPQGTLREAAMELVARRVPPHTEAEVRTGLTRALEMAASLGITTLHEASADERVLGAYADAEREGRLTARTIVSLRVDPTRGAEQVAELAALRSRYEGHLVRPVAAKLFLDGVIEGGTAALLEPYLDRAGWRGELRASGDSLASLVSALDSVRFKVHVHAVGDRAVRVALDALERRHERDGGAGPRHVLAHLQLVDPEDLARFAELGVVASFQPLWAYRDSYITDLTEPRLGGERSSRLYPIKSVLAAGATLAAGSDWPVTSMDPLDAMEVSITRRSPDAGAGEPWLPEERVTLAEILHAYTMGGALASDLEHETGSIAVGKSADLVVLERDLYAIDPLEISDVRVDLTVLEGRIVYRRPGS